jgi:hypothetical protein
MGKRYSNVLVHLLCLRRRYLTNESSLGKEKTNKNYCFHIAIAESGTYHELAGASGAADILVVINALPEQRAESLWRRLERRPAADENTSGYLGPLIAEVLVLEPVLRVVPDKRERAHPARETLHARTSVEKN